MHLEYQLCTIIFSVTSSATYIAEHNLQILISLTSDHINLSLLGIPNLASNQL